MLLKVLHDFVDAGNTVLVVEHNLDVIKTADWVIDLGPEGGAGGGRIVADRNARADRGRIEASYTGQALRALLDARTPSSGPQRQAGSKQASRPRGAIGHGDHESAARGSTT